MHFMTSGTVVLTFWTPFLVWCSGDVREPLKRGSCHMHIRRKKYSVPKKHFKSDPKAQVRALKCVATGKKKNSEGFGLTFWDKIRRVGQKWSNFEGKNFWLQKSQPWDLVRGPNQFSWVKFSFFYHSWAFGSLKIFFLRVTWRTSANLAEPLNRGS